MELKRFLSIFSGYHEPKYTRVTDDAESEKEAERSAASSVTQQCLLSAYLFLTTCSSLVFISLFVFSNLRLGDSIKSPCSEVSIRREWRALTLDEKEEFVQAIYCLAETPSSWALNRTIYDDFAILHGGIGSWCHRSASFLPWHRYTLFVFENILKEKCSFTNAIPYWDWSLDWANMANSSIWDSATGFGGDGDLQGCEVVGEGRCVVDGPFTELRPIIYNHTYTTHCISRGFNDAKRNVTGQIYGTPYSPESIGSILRKQTYKEFVKEVENQLHNTLHQGVNGDFKAMTAANDPLFYVHHASLDRMWWRWQQEDPSVRLTAYEGKHMYNSTDGEASLDDILLYGGFAKDVSVGSVMDAEGGPLCYRYT